MIPVDWSLTIFEIDLLIKLNGGKAKIILFFQEKLNASTA